MRASPAAGSSGVNSGIPPAEEAGQIGSISKDAMRTDPRSTRLVNEKNPKPTWISPNKPALRSPPMDPTKHDASRR